MLTRKQTIEWIAALRSGKYVQGAGRLEFLTHDDKTEFCCLGVLAKINNLDTYGCILTANRHTDITLSVSPAGWTEEGRFSALGIPAIKTLEGNNYHSLVDANDNGVTFEAIADHLEKHYLPLTSPTE